MGNWDKVWAWQPKPALYHKKKTNPDLYRTDVTRLHSSLLSIERVIKRVNL